MKIKVNDWCNIKTEQDTVNPRAAAEITIPHLRTNLRPAEARQLAAALLEAAEIAENCQEAVALAHARLRGDKR